MDVPLLDSKQDRNHLIFALVLFLVFAIAEVMITHIDIGRWVGHGVDALLAAWVAKVLFGQG